MQEIISGVGLRVLIMNPYYEKTKGEMLRECLDQPHVSAAKPGLDKLRELPAIQVHALRTVRSMPDSLGRLSWHGAGKIPQ